ncbi:hypothetical protein [Streptomyces sp. NBC_01506]|uniref:hypothetical protein n=1 Tax=Streptomyces sp. NBC_01506 TaxID=2903887 RepID=UPI00386BFD75
MPGRFAGRAGTLRFQLEWGATRQAGGRDVSFAELSRGKRDDGLRFGLRSAFVTGRIALPRTTTAAPPGL